MGLSADDGPVKEPGNVVDHDHHGEHESKNAKDVVRDIKSPGVQRVEAMAAVLTNTDRYIIFFGVFILAYAYGLDGTVRYTFQTFATNDFKSHSLLAAVNCLRAVIAAAAQPTAGKIADVFGRVELIIVSVIFYTVGTIIESQSNTVDIFIAGAVLYQVGYTMILVLVEVIIADITSTRARLFFSYIPALPFIINTWVSGDITDAITKNSTWHWGIGMWAIIYPACSLPLILSLWFVGRRARKQGLMDGYKSTFQDLGYYNFFIELFWLLDVIGVILMIAVFALLLAPLTLAGGEKKKWGEAHIIAPLVVGFVTIPFFVWWELKAPHPLVPFRRMKDRGVWGPMGIAVFLNFAWQLQGDFLFTVAIVAFNFSVKAATRVTSLYSFTSVITGVILGLIVYKVRRLKWFMVAGTCLFMVAFGLLIHYRGDPGSAGRSGLIGAQVLLGFAGGMFPYPAQASLQAHVKHEHVAVMTGLYLAVYNIGSAFGYSVSGVIWNQILPDELNKNMNNMTQSVAFYGSPLVEVLNYPMGTPERDAIIKSYQVVQRYLCIGGICLCVPLIFFAVVTRNAKLNDEQSLVKDESDGEGRPQV